MSADRWATDLFDVEPARLPLLDRTVADWQRSAMAAADASADIRLRCAPEVVASPPLLAGLAAAAAEAGAPLAAAVHLGSEHREFGPNPFGGRLDGTVLHYDLVADPTDGANASRNLDRAAPAGATSRPARPHRLATLHDGPVRLQPGRMATGIGTPTGQDFIWALGYWPDLLVINLLALQAATATIEADGPATIADTCDIHPTAVVERSRIGAGVSIGPFAVIRDSIVADGARVAEQTSVSGSLIGEGSEVQTGSLVHGSVVGPETLVSFHTAIRGSVLMGHSTISTPVVARSLIGRDVFLARGVNIAASTLTDTTISVRHGRRSVDSGMRLLGCVVGRGSRIGSGILLPAGYEVPADTFLADQPLPRVDADAPRRRPLLLIGRKFRSLSLSGEGRAASKTQFDDSKEITNETAH